MEPWHNGAYRIAAQIYSSIYFADSGTHVESWHDTQARFSTTLEGAKRVFEEMVRDEQRWLERWKKR